MARRQTIKNHIQETNLYRSRLFIFSILVIFMMGVLLTRVAYLQVFKNTDYQTQSNQNRIKLEPLPPNRGRIYDRNGVILAENRLVFSLEIIPEKVQDMDALLAKLQTLLPQVSADIIERFTQRLRASRRFESVPLLTGLNESEQAVLAVNQHALPGVVTRARIQRYYPFSETMVHMLGYVGRINDRELATIDQDNYRATRHIGKVGLEKYYEDELHGTIGYQEVETDVRGRVIRVLDRKNPVPGMDLHLHMDSRLQLEARRLLDDMRGVAIAVDPRNGGILALVSTPGYDPNPFVSGISTTGYQALLNSPDRPLFNRALRGQYSPGSTIKPMLGLLALEEGLVTAKTRMWDKGYFQLENDEHRYRDWKPEGHGWVNMLVAIRDSCDTYFYDLAVKLGIDRIAQGMKAFGFGQSTLLDMGEEVPALMPDRGWKQASRGVRWFPGETVIVGIGQGYWTSTPLQLVRATAAIANNGLLYPLSLGAKLANDNDNQLLRLDKQPDNIFPFKAQNMTLIQNTMKAVNEFPGSAFEAFKDARFTSAGKSGTVQLKSIAQDEEYDEELIDERLRDNALFVAYAPFEEPTIAVVVILENQGGGSKQAAPVARQIIEYYLELEDQL
ncbi:MAG: penicillin-binding protein 2 [Gammaproteobacteria bacterium]